MEGDDFGINIGSSRGATQLFEKHFEELQNVSMQEMFQQVGTPENWKKEIPMPSGNCNRNS